MHAEPGESESLDPRSGTMASREAAADADGQRGGAGEGRGAAVGQHHRKQVLSLIFTCESAPARHNACRVIWNDVKSERRFLVTAPPCAGT